MNRYLDIAPEVKEALDAGKPVVALESTIISHGMPYPQNVETALKVESIIREAGAVPATIAIIGGRLKAGLTREEIDYLGKTGAGIPKASRRDLPVLVAQGRDGACTVTTTMMIADMAGIRVFATGGIGGVHRGAQETFDISADLEELADTSVMVICAGAKSILDLGLTLEYLETHGVTVIGYGTDELPAFYTRKSGFGVDYELDTPAELAKAFHVKRELGLRGGLLVTNPIPEEYSMDKAVIDKAIAEAVEDAKKISPAATAWIPTSSSCSTTPASALPPRWSWRSSNGERSALARRDRRGGRLDGGIRYGQPCTARHLSACHQCAGLRRLRLGQGAEQGAGRAPRAGKDALSARHPRRQRGSHSRDARLAPQDAPLVLQIRPAGDPARAARAGLVSRRPALKQRRTFP